MASGRFVTQNAGSPAEYRAFVPAALPPNPPIDLSTIWRDLSHADRALARLDGVATTVPDPGLFVGMYVRHEATFSSQIEGTQSTLEDVLNAESRSGAPSPKSDVDEIFNYIDALQHGLRRMADLPLSLRLLREIHARLLEGVRGERKTPGEFRTSQNWIGGDSITNASFVPPPPSEMNQALHDLELFLHRPDDIPVLVHCALVHAQFETIHPFCDGNGRIGRLLVTLQLCHEAVLRHPLLYLSYFFKVYRQEYYDRLQAVRINNDWTGWIRFFLRGVAAISESATSTARSIYELRETLLAKPELTKNGRDLVQRLFAEPFMTAKRAAELLDCTFVTANNSIAQLEALGVLQEVTGNKRNRRFRFSPYLQLFERQALPISGDS